MQKKFFSLATILFFFALASALSLGPPSALGAEKCLKCHGNEKMLKALIPEKKKVLRSAETSGEG
jgi:hypothetical protein